MNTKKALLNALVFWRARMNAEPKNEHYRKLFHMARGQYKFFHHQNFNNSIQIMLPL